MSTPKEIFLELIRPDGQPERQLRQYEALHMCLTDPCNTYLRGNRKRGTTSVDRWGTTILFPEDAPGPMPDTREGLAVCPDVTRWRETVGIRAAGAERAAAGRQRQAAGTESAHLAGKVGKAALVRALSGRNGFVIEIIAQRPGRLYKDAGVKACDAARGRLDAAAAGRAGPVVPVSAAAAGRAHIAYRLERHRRRHIQLCPVGKAVLRGQRLGIVHMQSLLTKQSLTA